MKISQHQLGTWWSQIEFTGDALSEPVNGYLRPLNPQLLPWNFQIQNSYLHSNVIMCIDVYWQDDVSGNQAERWVNSRNIHSSVKKVVACITKTIKSTIDTVIFSNTIQLCYLHSNVIMGIDLYCLIIDKMT